LFVLNFVYHAMMFSQTCSLLPSNRNRSTFVHALITAFDLLRSPPNGASYAISLLRPSPACESDLTAYHDRCYVDALLADPPGPDRTTHSEFGLECVRRSTSFSNVQRANILKLNAGLRAFSWPQRICPRGSRRVNDSRARTCGRQV
jgi:hypothetical protein